MWNKNIWTTLALLVLSACASNESIDGKKLSSDTPLHRSYMARYDEGAKEITLVAQARVKDADGWTVDFTGSDGFYTNGKRLPVVNALPPANDLVGPPVPEPKHEAEGFQDLFNPHFKGTRSVLAEKAVKPEASYPIEMRRNGQKSGELVNLLMPPAVTLKAEKAEYRKGDAYLVTWETSALDSSEVLEAVVKTITPGQILPQFGFERIEEKSGKKDIGPLLDKVEVGTQFELRYRRVRHSRSRDELQQIQTEYLSAPLIIKKL